MHTTDKVKWRHMTTRTRAKREFDAKLRKLKVLIAHGETPVANLDKVNPTQLNQIKTQEFVPPLWTITVKYGNAMWDCL
jgi:hypothetical protein